MRIILARRTIFKILLLLFSLILSFFISEGILSLIDYNYTPLRIQVDQNTDWRFFHAFQDHNFIYDPELIWKPKANETVFNSQGFRGKEVSLEKSPQEFRIFALGDSNTLGWNVTEGYGLKAPNWPIYLEEMLHKINENISVINAGVWGYTSFQGLIRLKKLLIYQPDLVFISFGSNDAQQVAFSDAEFSKRKISQMKLDKILMKFRIGQVILATSDILFSKNLEKPVARVNLLEYKNNLDEMIRICKAKQIIVVLLSRPYIGESPTPLCWKTFIPEYNAAVSEIAAKNEVLFIDIYSHFKDKDMETLFQDESHFNEEGHRQAARTIFDAIKPMLNSIKGKKIIN